MTAKPTPTHIAYCAKREGPVLRWLEVGIASPHRDGMGYDVVLDRLPVGGFTGRILVRDNRASPPEPELPVPPSE